MAEELNLQIFVPRGRRYTLLGLTVLSAIATRAAFPPWEWIGLAWIAPGLLMLVLSQTPPREGFFYGWLFGWLYMSSLLTFILPYGFLPWILLSLIMGLYYAVFGFVGSVLRTADPLGRVPALAGAWLLLEYVRGHMGSFALTFGHLAYSQATELPFIQLASVFGHYGVSFLMALLSAGLSCFVLTMLPLTWLRPLHGPAESRPVQRYNRQAGRVALACFVLVLLNYVWGRWEESQGRKELQTVSPHALIRVAAIQAEGKATFRHTEAIIAEYERLTRPQKARLIVWPETAIGRPLNLDRQQLGQMAALAQEKKAYMLVGALEMWEGYTFNSAYFFQPDGCLQGIYRKIDLVMFGEYVPFRKQLPFLRRYPIRPIDFTAGRERVIFSADGFDMAPLICFEGIFPDQTRQVARRGAQFIVILTSDVWAKDKIEVRLHSAIAPFRAIEARKYLIRAAANGRTAIYDAYGNMLASVSFGENGAAVADVLPLSHLSLYHRWGDMPLLTICVLAIMLGLIRSQKGSFIVRRGTEAHH